MIEYLETMIVLAGALAFAWLKIGGFAKPRMQIVWVKEVPIYWWLYVLLILFTAFAISSSWGALPRD